ncbi:hypothetical protein [Pseudobutyrivibrio sp.]|uniref:ATP-binding protein n=1 Tax=Pseudobutyrivibrio sp. TaxID=2014367 RepID=UPI00386A5396
MRPYLKYISKQFSRLILLLCGLAVINVFIFFTFFYKLVKTDYTMSSPSPVLLKISSDCSITGISDNYSINDIAIISKGYLNDYPVFIHTNDESLSKPHYFEALDERLDLRHGLGLIIVKQIIEAHGGTIDTPEVSTGYKTILSF